MACLRCSCTLALSVSLFALCACPGEVARSRGRNPRAGTAVSGWNYCSLYGVRGFHAACRDDLYGDHSVHVFLSTRCSLNQAEEDLCNAPLLSLSI